jgi:hypothetical protein
VTFAAGTVSGSPSRTPTITSAWSKDSSPARERRAGQPVALGQGGPDPDQRAGGLGAHQLPGAQQRRRRRGPLLAGQAAVLDLGDQAALPPSIIRRARSQPGDRVAQMRVSALRRIDRNNASTSTRNRRRGHTETITATTDKKADGANAVDRSRYPQPLFFSRFARARPVSRRPAAAAVPRTGIRPRCWRP